MSALLVTAAPTERRALRLGPVTPEVYRAFLASRSGADGPSFLQVPAWARVKDGWQHQLVGWGPESGELTGVALVLLRPFPGTRKYFAYLPEGPVADWADPDLDRWLAPLLGHLRACGVFAVRMGPGPAYRRWNAATVKAGTGTGRRLSDVLADEVDPLGTEGTGFSEKLNRAAYTVGGLVAAGHLTTQDAENALMETALLVRPGQESRAQAIIRSGMAAGARRPLNPGSRP